MPEQVQRAFPRWSGNLGNMGYDQNLKAPGVYSLEIRRERGNVKQAFTIIKGLAEIQRYHGTLLQIRRNEALTENGERLCENP